MYTKHRGSSDVWQGPADVCELRPGVLLQVGELAETFLTVGAAVRFDAQVYAQVLRQVGRVGEGLCAVRTLVSLGLRVRFGVDLHVGLGEERQRTDFTPVTHGDTSTQTDLHDGRRRQRHHVRGGSPYLYVFPCLAVMVTQAWSLPAARMG